MSTLTLLSDEAQKNADRLAFFNTVRFEAHGYHIFRGRLAAGKSYTIELPEDTSADAVNMATVWTKGRVTAASNGVLPDRVPGLFSKGRTQIYPKGSYKYVVVEDSEWWCLPGFNDIVNLLTVPAHESVSLPAVTIGVVLSGDLSFEAATVSSGEPFAVKSTTKTAKAGEETVYAFTFDRTATT